MTATDTKLNGNYKQKEFKHKKNTNIKKVFKVYTKKDKKYQSKRGKATTLKHINLI